MARLTERFSNGQAAVAGCGKNCKYNFKYCKDNYEGNCPTLVEIYEKLAFYEDLEENNKLSVVNYDTCKECIHYDVCENAFGDWLPKPCDSFKNKSNFIELPCPIGSTVYMVVNAQNTWDDVAYRAVLPVQFKLDMLPSFNKRFFLTQKEAERKLEEILR